jgi:PilZ domain
VALQSREASFETSIDKRNFRRHRLILEVEARDSSPTSGTVTVYDISNTGLLIETNSSLSIGEMIEVQLPLVGFQTAEIVWTSGHLVGCKFSHALTQGTVSAARLGAVPVQSSKTGRLVSIQQASLDSATEQHSINAYTEKFSVGVTLRVVLGLAILSWVALVMIIVALIYY